MIYLIGGPPRCGKTILARRLGQRLDCSILPSDYLGAAIWRYLPATEREARFPSVGEGVSNDERFAHFSAAELLARFRTRSRTIWPGLEAVIDYARSEGRDYIIEGCHIEPGFAHQLAVTRSGEHFRVGFLIKTDLEGIVAGLRESREAGDWAREWTADPATFRAIAAWMRHYGEYIRAETTRYGLPLFHTDDFVAGLDMALAHFAASPAVS